MAADGHLNFDTKINTNGFNKGLDAISKLVGGAGKAVSGLGKAFMPVTAAVTGVGTAAVKTTIDFTKLYESTMVVFEKMLGGKAAANGLYDSLLSIAKASTFSQEAFLTAGKTLVGMGTDAEHTTKYMQAITDAVAGFGGTSQNLKDVATNFAKISTAGRLSMEDVNILSDNGIQALKILGNQYGKTSEEMREMISSGAVPAQEALDKLTEGIEKGTDGVNGYTAAMEGMSLAMKGKTLTGALDSLHSGFRAFALNLTGINPTLKETDEGYAESTKRLGQLTAAVSTIAGILPSAAGVFKGVTDAVGKLLDKLIGSNVAFDEATGQWTNVEGVLGRLKGALDTMDPAKLKSIGDAILGMAAAGVVLPAIGRGMATVKDAIRSVSAVSGTASANIKKIPGTFQELGKNIGGLKKNFGNLKDTILLPFEGLRPKLSTYISGIGELWETGPGGKIVSGAKDVVNKVSGAFQKLAGSTLGAYASLMGDALQGVLKSAGKFAPAFIKLLGFGTILGAFVAGLGLLQGQFGEQINGFLQMAAEKGPAIVEGLCSGITGKLPELIALGGELLVNLMNAVTANIPAVISGGISIIAGLVTGIASQLPALIPVALQMILTIITSLIQNIPQLINAGLQLLTGLAQGIINAIPVLINAIPGIIQGLVSGIAQNLPAVIATGIQILAMLVAGIIQAIPQLLAAIPDIFKAFADGIMSVDWAGVGKGILDAVVNGIKSIAGSFVDSVKSIFTGGEQAAEESGANAGNKYAAGMESANETVAASAMNLGASATGGIGMAGTTEAFTANAQNAANGFSATLANNGSVAGMAGNILGTAANNGVAGAGMYGAFNQSGATAGQGLSEGISGQAGAVAGAASSVASTAQASVSSVNLGGAYSTVGSQAMQGLASSISSGNASVSTASAGITRAAAAGLTGGRLPEAAKTEGKNMVTGLSGAIKAGNGTVRSAVSSLMTAAKTAANGLGTAGHTAGVQFSTGLANGILAGQHGVAQAAAQVANAAAQAAKSNLDIHSPSKVGEYIGNMFDTGIAKGVVRNINKVKAGIFQMTDTLSEGAGKALKSLQNRANYNMTISGLHLHEQAAGTKNQPFFRASEWLDEWERRQKKINQERDARPVLIDGRRVDRAMGKKGVVTV